MTPDWPCDPPPTVLNPGPGAAPPPPVSLQSMLAGLGAVNRGEWLALLRCDQHKRWHRGR